MSLVAIVDYGMGNIRSVQKACEYLGHTTCLTQNPDILSQADRVILPGVGAFAAAMAQLRQTGFDQALKAYVGSGKPLLGICLGMQLFFESSTEGSRTQGLEVGLGLLPGMVTRFPTHLPIKIPHIGWNEIETRPGQLFAGLPPRFSVYFVHSYQVNGLEAPFVAGIAHHGKPFLAALEQNNLMATQFHPEKSGTYGLHILNNFLNFTPKKTSIKLEAGRMESC